MHSRRRSREFLLQSLYSRTELKSDFQRASFIESYFNESGVESFELAYIDLMESMILEHEKELIAHIAFIAPKFELPTIPVMHILILMIALTEMLYAKELDIPEAVAVNEAIELAKRFSDDHGRIFINGALSTFIKERDGVILGTKAVDFRVF